MEETESNNFPEANCHTSMLHDDAMGDPVQKKNKKDKGCPQRVLRFLKDNLLMTLSVLGVVIGFIVGFAVRTTDPSPTAIMWLGLPGEMFLNLLRMTIVPLILASVISATATMDPRENGKIGGWLMAYMVTTNLLVGAGLGTLMSLLLRLDSPSSDGSDRDLSTSLETSDIIADLLRNLFPENLVRATMFKRQTTYPSTEEESNPIGNSTEKNIQRILVWSSSINIMGLIFGSAVFGMACSCLPEKSKPFANFFNSMMDIVLLILQWVVWTSPIGVFSLVAASVAEIGDLAETFRQLGIFVVVVIAGLAIQQIILFPVIYFVFTRTNPFKAMLKTMEAWFIGFAAQAAVCSIPYQYDICEDLGYDKRVYKMGIPMMQTFNCNGSSLFIVVAVQLLADLNGTPLSMGNTIVLWLLTTVTCMALPSVPSGSLVVIVILCTALNIPAESVGLFFTVEWLLDRARTGSNIMGRVLGVGVVNSIVCKDLTRKDQVDSLDRSAEKTDCTSI